MGCVYITTDLQPVNPDVQAALVGEDCSPIVLGFGFGHNTVANAQRDNILRADERFEGFQRLTTPITKVRVISLEESTMLLFGQRCLKVTGEP
jgi:hypothetical protein